MFEFPDNSYGTVYTTLCAPASSTIRENNIYNVDLLRVGLWKVAETRNAEVLAFLKSENMPYEIIYYETAEEQLEAFNNGSVDVISSVSLSPVANSRIVAQFAPRPYYFASTKGNTELITKLDETIELIDKVEPNLQDTLYYNYFRVANDAFHLSDEQKAVLAEKKRYVAVEKFTSAPEHTYNAVLMDVMMPVMNGCEATKAIRTSKHPEALTIPIVAMTANASVKDVQDALDAGMNAHIAKPINMEALKNTLASCIILNTNKIKEKICAEILYIRDCRLDFFQILNGV